MRRMLLTILFIILPLGLVGDPFLSGYSSFVPTFPLEKPVRVEQSTPIIVAQTGAASYGQSSMVTLKEHIERLLDERCRVIDQRFEEQDRALDLARAEMERRLEGLNQLRQDVTKDRAEYVTRDVFELRVAPLEKSVTQLETRMITGMAAIGIIFLVIDMMFHFLGKKNNRNKA